MKQLVYYYKYKYKSNPNYHYKKIESIAVITTPSTISAAASIMVNPNGVCANIPFWTAGKAKNAVEIAAVLKH